MEIKIELNWIELIREEHLKEYEIKHTNASSELTDYKKILSWGHMEMPFGCIDTGRNDGLFENFWLKFC